AAGRRPSFGMTPDDAASMVSPRRRAIEARRLSLEGRPEQATQVLQPSWDARSLEVMVEKTRMAVAKDDLDAAALLLERWPIRPEPRAHLTQYLWRAVVAYQGGDERQAVELISRVVGETARENFSGLYFEVGRPIVGPLRAQYRTAPSAFIRRILEDPSLQLSNGERRGRSTLNNVNAPTEQE